MVWSKCLILISLTYVLIECDEEKIQQILPCSALVVNKWEYIVFDTFKYSSKACAFKFRDCLTFKHFTIEYCKLFSATQIVVQ